MMSRERSTSYARFVLIWHSIKLVLLPLEICANEPATLKIQTNAFHRYDVDLGQVGIFLEPTLAMANHSCIPNALVQFIGRKAILRAEMPIKSGEEIVISYTGSWIHSCHVWTLINILYRLHYASVEEKRSIITL